MIRFSVSALVLLDGAIGVSHGLKMVFFAKQVDLAQSQFRRHRPSVFPAVNRSEAHPERLSHRFLCEVQPFSQLFDSGPKSLDNWFIWPVSV